VSNYTNQTQNVKSNFSDTVAHRCSVVGHHLDSG